MLDQDFLEYVRQCYQEFTNHDAEQSDRLDRFRNIEPESAEYLYMQIMVQQSKQILEIGTSTGYSTLWLAKAAKSTLGVVDTVEIDPKRIAIAKQNAKQLKLDELINFNQLDALDYLSNNHKLYDFILLDAERSAYISYWSSLSGLIREKGGLLIVDNVISHASEVAEFISMIENDSQFTTYTLKIGAGLLLVARQ